MKLANPFSVDTRELYRYTHECLLCGGNQMLELNHIFGRVSSSSYNASLLCNQCHSHVGHSVEEHAILFARNARFLSGSGYVVTEKDLDFLKKHVDPIKKDVLKEIRSWT